MVLELIGDAVGAVVSLITWIISLIIEIITSVVHFATSSRESALAFVFVFVLLFGVLAYQAFDAGMPIETKLFGTASIRNTPLVYTIDNSSIEYMESIELVKLTSPVGDSWLYSKHWILNPQGMSSWTASNYSECSSVAGAQDETNYIWSAYLELSPPLKYMFELPWADASKLEADYTEPCGYMAVSATHPLTNVTDRDSLNAEITTFENSGHTLCSDFKNLQYGKHSLGWYDPLQGCWAIRNNVTFERINYGRDSSFDIIHSGQMVINWMDGRHQPEGVLNDNYYVEVTDSGPFSPIIEGWLTIKIWTNKLPEQIASPIMWTLSALEGFFESVAMIVITILGVIVLITIGKWFM